MFCLMAVLRSDRKERCHFLMRSLLRFRKVECHSWLIAGGWWQQE